MQDLLVILFGMAFFSLFLSFIFADMPKKKEHCKTHKWGKDNELNVLKCQECGFIAGTHNSSHGEY